MQLSARARYAVTAMADLAGCASGDAPPPVTPPRVTSARVTPLVTLGQIAARQQISQCYLEQLFGALRRAGLVVSARGPGGGYRLARPAGRIAIADIIAAIDEPICVRDPGPAGCPAMAALWSALAAHINVFFAGITLADVLAGAFEAPAPQRHQAAE